MLNDRLKKYSNAPAIHATYATSDTSNTVEVARVARVQVATPAESEVISNWWLIHFADLDPVQVAIWPPCSHADVLKSHPEAIAAEPLPPQVLDEDNNCLIDQSEKPNATLDDIIES